MLRLYVLLQSLAIVIGPRRWKGPANNYFCTAPDCNFIATKWVHVAEQSDELKDTTVARCEAHAHSVRVSPRQHDSDCAVHNGPALPVGPCNCKLAEATS